VFPKSYHYKTEICWHGINNSRDNYAGAFSVFIVYARRTATVNLGSGLCRQKIEKINILILLKTQQHSAWTLRARSRMEISLFEHVSVISLMLSSFKSSHAQ